MIGRYLTAMTVLAAAALLAVGCSTSHPAASAPGPQRLADCTGVPHVRPTVVVRCIDDSMIARQLKWSGWGTPVATATGTAILNMCEFVPQDCALGDYQSYSVVLIASGSLRCPTGRPPTHGSRPSSWAGTVASGRNTSSTPSPADPALQAGNPHADYVVSWWPAHPRGEQQ
jgi:hypothetical protein